MAKAFKVICFAVQILMLPHIVNANEEIAETETAVKKTLPVGADFQLANNVGAGAISEAYQQDPYVASTLYIFPNVKFGPFWGERQFTTQVELKGELEWMGQGNPIGKSFGDKFNLYDVKVRAELSKALYESDSGISLSPAFKMELPASKSSRDDNRIIGLGGYLNATWSKWGFFATYKPVFVAYAHSAPYKSGNCADDASADDKLSNGSCKVAGRQTMMMLKNGFFTGYNRGSHTVTLGFRTYHQFLRESNQGEKPEKEAGSGVMEATLALVEYGYKLPVTMPTAIVVGLQGYQAPYDASNKFRAPFVSFAEPEKNQTEAYLAFNVSI